MSKKFTYKQFGERAVLIEWEAKIAEDILKDITFFKNKIQAILNDEVEDCIIGYHSLTIVFKEFIDFSIKVDSLQKIYLEKGNDKKTKNYLWEIPVCYDTQFGIDLEELSVGLKLSVEEIIELHSETIYTIYFIGFLPGFLYLGGLDSRLHFPRKATPRLKTPKGSVAIGGSQTGIYPQESPGGWNLTGNTPILFFDLTKEQPCFAKSGDKIKFIPVDLDSYKNIQNQIEKGSYIIPKTIIND